MYVQFYPVYGFMVGMNYWNSNMEGFHLSESEDTEHLFQILIGVIGISFHVWREE